MPSRPYFHGGEEFYLHDGVLLAHLPPRVNPHGVPIHETVSVVTLDKRYCLGWWMDLGNGRASAWCHRTSKGDRVDPPTLSALVGRCREVFAGRSRYAVGAHA